MCFTWMMSFFVVNQKTAYEMRISDWSSDVCSADLRERRIMMSSPHSNGGRLSQIGTATQPGKNRAIKIRRARQHSFNAAKMSLRAASLVGASSSLVAPHTGGDGVGGSNRLAPTQ